jgi:hypothetical protein
MINYIKNMLFQGLINKLTYKDSIDIVSFRHYDFCSIENMKIKENNVYK